jgi:ribulose-5-phosphate 4-epimerase/fuculose-1-phosphate aldolase
MPRKTAPVMEIPVLKEFLKISQDIWLKGWAERNAGNASIRLAEDEVRAASI